MGTTVNDPNNDIALYESELASLAAADIPAEERDSIHEFAEYKFNTCKPKTAATQLNTVRVAAVRAATVGMKPLTEWKKADFESYIARIGRGDFPDAPEGGWQPGTVRNYRQHLKNYLKYHGHEWAESITIGKPQKTKVKREHLLTQDEIAALFDAADNPRDKCLIALPLATLQRSGAVRALRVGDVSFPDGQAGYVTLNADAHGQKDADGARPLAWAGAYVEKWLQVHPQRNSPDFADAPLLCALKDNVDSTGRGSHRGDPLSKYQYNRRLRTIAERAGIDQSRWDTGHGDKQSTLATHLLRHTGIQRYRNDPRFSDAIIKRWAGWSENSDQLDNYGHTEDDDVLAAVNSAYGHETDDAMASLRPDPDTCDRCGAETEGWMRACPACSLILDDELAEQHQSGRVLVDGERIAELEAFQERVKRIEESMAANVTATPKPDADVPPVHTRGESDTDE